MTLMMTSAQVVETSVNVINNSPSRDYSHPDDQTTQTNVVFVVTILSSSVFSQACIQISARLVTCGAVKAIDLVYRLLSVLWFLFVLDVGQ